MSSECECPLAGYCERHKLAKGGHWHKLCQERDDYREKWDAGRGPGQHNPELQIARELQRKTRFEKTRLLWEELHTQLNPTDQWLQKWIKRIPSFGCGCKQGFKDIMAANPPRYNDWFAWTVEVHNAVNRKLNRREWTIEEARARWL